MELAPFILISIGIIVIPGPSTAMIFQLCIAAYGAVRADCYFWVQVLHWQQQK